MSEEKYVEMLEDGTLYDYITNLQDEYEKEHYLVDKLTRQLNDEYKNTEYQCKQKEDYKSRCEKAISYIKEKGIYNEEYNLCTQPINSMKLDNLLNILQGSDNNE